MQHPIHDSIMCTSTSLVHYPHVESIYTFSLVSTTLHDGLKPFTFLNLQLRLWLELSYMDGSHVLEYLPPLRQIMVHNSNQHSGNISWSYWVPIEYELHPIIQCLMVWLKDSMDISLKSHPYPEHWMNALPFVLLGIWTTIKENVQQLNLFIVPPYTCLVLSSTPALHKYLHR